MRKTFATVLGLLSLAAVWVGMPLIPSAHSFSAHMTVHMTVVAIAAPLLALGLAGTRGDPSRRHPTPFQPLLASVVELVVVWLWHTPLMHKLAQESGIALALEQLTFLAAGLMLWIAVLGGDSSERASRGASGIAALLLTAMHMTLLGALLALSPRPLYPHLHGGPGLSALDDQQLGGVIMLLVGGVSYLAGGLWLSSELLRESRPKLNGGTQERRAERADRQP